MLKNMFMGGGEFNLLVFNTLMLKNYHILHFVTFRKKEKEKKYYHISKICRNFACERKIESV